MNFLGFGQSAEIDIVFDNSENRKQVEVKGEDGKTEKMFLYLDGETVSGKVCILYTMNFENILFLIKLLAIKRKWIYLVINKNLTMNADK